jgi:CubicO group peptidase (beta-lactamase class C family)
VTAIQRSNADAKELTSMRRIAMPVVLAALCQSAVVIAATMPTPAAIDAEVERLMTRADVKGLAIAVIDDGDVSYVAAYGFRNVDAELPLETDTVMYGASLTKTAFAYMVLQLVDEGLLDLDKPLGSYLPEPLPDYDAYRDLAGDSRWEALTARHVLNHSTGFHNFRWLEDDRVLRFHFQPGERYAYSGEGFNLLQFVLEEGLELDVKAEMQRRVFDRFGMTDTSMQWREDFADNLADGYAIDGSFEPHDERSNVRAAGSMDTTIADQA